MEEWWGPLAEELWESRRQGRAAQICGKKASVGGEERNEALSYSL